MLIKSIFTPNQIKFDDKTPVICIIGGGLSGLLTAINIKEKNSSFQVVVLDKIQNESNTQISGMRIRSKCKEVSKILGEQNNNIIIPQMREFSKILNKEIKKWNKRLLQIDSDFVKELPTWFGPQWGKKNIFEINGRGKSVLDCLRSIAFNNGVKFLSGEVQTLNKEKEIITSITLTNKNEVYIFKPDVIVLANGNAAGSLFLSTNRLIRNSATELLFNAGLPLEGGTLTMWHPFGKCQINSKPMLGCYETDSLEKTDIFFINGIKDKKTTKLLQDHQAHYSFKKISKRFIKNGGIVKLSDDSEQKFARVSLHYSHLGAHTVNGVLVETTSNLFVVGDAGGLLYWTNYHTRLPGFALAHCIVSAKKASNFIVSKFKKNKLTIFKDNQRITKKYYKIHNNFIVNDKLRTINTKYILELEFGKKNLRKKQIISWRKELYKIKPKDNLTLLSLALVDGWSQLIDGKKEPITISYNKKDEK